LSHEKVLVTPPPIHDVQLRILRSPFQRAQVICAVAVRPSKGTGPHRWRPAGPLSPCGSPCHFSMPSHASPSPSPYAGPLHACPVIRFWLWRCCRQNSASKSAEGGILSLHCPQQMEMQKYKLFFLQFLQTQDELAPATRVPGNHSRQQPVLIQTAHCDTYPTRRLASSPSFASSTKPNYLDLTQPVSAW
jgi:hypothetical protein